MINRDRIVSLLDAQLRAAGCDSAIEGWFVAIEVAMRHPEWWMVLVREVQQYDTEHGAKDGIGSVANDIVEQCPAEEN